MRYRHLTLSGRGMEIRGRCLGASAPRRSPGALTAVLCAALLWSSAAAFGVAAAKAASEPAFVRLVHQAVEALSASRLLVPSAARLLAAPLSY